MKRNLNVNVSTSLMFKASEVKTAPAIANAIEDLLERVRHFWQEMEKLPYAERRIVLSDILTWIEVAEDEIEYIPILNKVAHALGVNAFVAGPYSANVKGLAHAMKGLYCDLRPLVT